MARPGSAGSIAGERTAGTGPASGQPHFPNCDLFIEDVPGPALSPPSPQPPPGPGQHIASPGLFRAFSLLEAAKFHLASPC